jgi:hypothetical protein
MACFGQIRPGDHALNFWYPTLELNTGRFQTFPAAGLLTPILTIDGRNVADIMIMI